MQRFPEAVKDGRFAAGVVLKRFLFLPIIPLTDAEKRD